MRKRLILVVSLDIGCFTRSRSHLRPHRLPLALPLPATKGKGREDDKELFLALVDGSLSSSKTFVRSRSF
jgi:hypothetical protein